MNADGELTTLELRALGASFAILQRPRSHDHAFAVWDAGTGLLRALEADVKLQAALRGRRVLDVGAGCGLVAFALASRLACHVVATDLPHALPHLRACAALNGFKRVDESDVAPMPAPDGSGGSLTIAAHDWGSDVTSLLRLGGGAGESCVPGFDAVLGTDVVYSEALVPRLVRSLAAVALLGRPARKTVAYLANEERCSATHARFLAVASHMFSVRPLRRRRGGGGGGGGSAALEGDPTTADPGMACGDVLRLYEMKLRPEVAGGDVAALDARLAQV